MAQHERLEFSHAGRKDVYSYVEDHGVVDPDEVPRSLNMEDHEFGHHLAILKRDALLEETDGGKLRVAYTKTADEDFTDDDLEYTIRQARQADITGLIGAMRSAIDNGTYIVAESVADILDHEEVLLRHNEVQSRMFFVACVDTDVVGWVHITHPEVEKLAHTAELTLGVVDDYRGHGIGSKLMERGLEWAADQGYEKIYNSLPSGNERGLEFLQDHGWHEAARREDHYKVDGEYLDEVMMEIDV